MSAAPAFARGRRRPGRGLALGLLVLSLGCQTVAPEPGTPIEPDDPQVRGLLRSVRDLAAQRTALRGTAKLWIDAPQVRFSRPQRIVLQKPASLRIEVLGLFDQVAGIVVTDGTRFSFVELISGTRDSGLVDDGLLWRTARVDLTPSEAVSLLLGAPSLDRAARVVRAVRFADGGAGALVRSADEFHWLEWNGAGGLRRAERRASDGSVQWSALFGDHRDVDGVSFAHSIELAFPRVDASASLEYSAVELQPELSPALFVLQVAPGE